MDQDKIAKQLDAIFPQVIGAVITHDHKDGRVNLAPINFQAVSTKYEHPASVCIGLSNQSSTLKNILDSKQFVYAYPNPNQVKDIIYCGTVSGHTTDKMKNTKLKFKKSNQVEPPTLQEAVINFECELTHSYKAGDFTIIVGEVKYMQVNDSRQKIYSLGGTKYGTLKIDEILQEGR